MTKSSSDRVRPPPTATSLANAALQYLARYAASEAALRRVLQTRIRRGMQTDPEFATDRDRQAELAAAIEAIIARHRASGALNDAVYAEMKVRTLRQRGRSRRVIAQDLAARGIANDIVAQALATLDEDHSPEESDLTAARLLARKRKLGPYRRNPVADPLSRTKAEQRDMAVLIRAGFSYRVVKQVLGSDILDVEDTSDDAWD